MEYRAEPCRTNTRRHVYACTRSRESARRNPRARAYVHVLSVLFFRLDYILHIIGFTLDCLLGGGIFLGGFICGRINCMRGGAANRERTESRGMRPIINADSFFFVYLAKLPKAVSVHGETKEKKNVRKKMEKNIDGRNVVERTNIDRLWLIRTRAMTYDDDARSLRYGMSGRAPGRNPILDRFSLHDHFERDRSVFLIGPSRRVAIRVNFWSSENSMLILDVLSTIYLSTILSNDLKFFFSTIVNGKWTRFVIVISFLSTPLKDVEWRRIWIHWKKGKKWAWNV